MQRTLSDLYKQNADLFYLSEENKQIVSLFLTENISQEKIASVLLPLLSKDRFVENTKKTTKELLCILLACKQHNLLLEKEQKKFIQKIGSFTRHLSSAPMVTISRQMIDFLIDEAKKQKPNLSQIDCVFNSCSIQDNAFIPNVSQSCELLSVYVLLVHLLDEEVDRKEMEKMANSYLSLLDQTYFPLTGLWTKEIDFDLLGILTSYYLLYFSLAKLVDSKYEFIAERLLEHIEGLLEEGSSSFSLFPLAVCFFLENIEKQSSFTEEPILLSEGVHVDPNFAFVSHRSSSYDAAFSLYGVNTGLGSIHMKDVRMQSCGAQHFPLTDSRGYGSYRERSTITAPEEIVCSKDSNGSYLQGWSSICRFAQYEQGTVFAEKASLWQETRIHTANQKCSMSIAIFGDKNFEKIAFSFFIQAKTCHLGEEKVFLSHSMERYVGKIQELSFRGKQASLCIKAQSNAPMYLAIVL